MLKYNLIVLVLLLLYSFFANAQKSLSPSCLGIVTDEWGSPISNVSINLLDRSEIYISDSTGMFKLDNLLDKREYRFLLQAVGFKNLRVELTYNQDSTIRFVLEPLVNRLETVKINASKRGLSINDTIISYQREQIKGKLVSEVFARLSGVSVLYTGHNTVKPVLHGLHSNRVIINNQGVNLESQQWGLEHSPEIDPFSADHFEVIKGASAVRYGAGALAGVLLSRSSEINSEHFKGVIDLLGSSNGKGLNGNLQIESGIVKVPGLAFRFQSSIQIQGNTRTPSYYLGNTSSRQQNFSGLLQYHKGKNKVNFYYSQFANELGVYYGAHLGTIEDLKHQIEQERPINVYDFSYKIDVPKQSVTHRMLRLNYQKYLGNSWRLESSYALQKNMRKEFDRRRNSTDEIPMVDLELTTQSAEVILQSQKHSLGVQGKITVNNNISGTGTTPIIPNYDFLGFGIFGIHRVNLEPLAFELGWRYDFSHFDAAGYKSVFDNNIAAPNYELIQDNRNFSNFSGTAGLSYPISENWYVQTNFDLSWRAPSANELFSDGVHHGAGIYEIGNRNLTQERGYKWIVSFENHGGKFVSKLDLYTQYIADYIYANPMSDSIRQTIRGSFPVFQYEQNNAIFYGVDLKFQWQLFSKITYSTKLNLVHAKDVENNRFLPYIPATKINQEIKLAIGKENRNSISFSHEYNFKQFRYEPSSDFLPPPNAYQLMNLNLRHLIKPNKNSMVFNLTVENLLNTEYKDYMDRFRYFAHRPGRNFKLSINYQF